MEKRIVFPSIKIMNKTIFALFSFIAFLSSCSSRNGVYELGVTKTLEIGDVSDAVDKVFSEEFTDFEIIKLDNTYESQMSWVNKMCVTDRGFFFLDYKLPAKVLHFDSHGKFICRIGDYGKKTSEYVNIYNFSANDAGDTIAILDSRKVIRYNNSGEHLSTETLNEHVDDIILTKQGLFAADYHHENPHLLGLYSNGDVTKSYVNIENNSIKGTSPSMNYLQQCGDVLCYYDYFSSCFYVADIHNMSKMKCYKLKSDDILDEVKSRESGTNRSKYSCVRDYVVTDSSIVGNIRVDERGHDFCIDMRNDTFSFVHFDREHYSFNAYHNGYYYRVVPAGFILDVLNEPYNAKVRELFSDALEPYKESTSEKDNYYVLKMRKK